MSSLVGELLSIYRGIKSPLTILALLLLVSVCNGSPTPTPTTSPPSASPPPACTGSEFRQFDFWVGSWTVTNPNGRKVGTSNITTASGRCAIREEWKSASGGSGMSINYFEPDDRKWHQHWVGGDGTILHLEGGLIGSAMVLSGTTKGANGQTLNRVTWTPLSDGKVKQEWTTSADDGKTWNVVFLGTYEKI